METSNSDLDKAIIFFASVITIMLLYAGITHYGSIQGLLNAINGFFSAISNFPKFSVNVAWHLNYGVILLWIFRILLLITILVVFSFLVMQIYFSIKRFSNKIKFEKREEIEIDNLLLEEYPSEERAITIEIETLRKKLSFTKDYQKLKRFNGKVKKRLETCLKLLEELRKDKRLKERKRQVELTEKRLQELDEEKRIKETQEEPDGYNLFYHLKAYEKCVFRKKDLSKNQIKALENHGFLQKNEYSIVDHKYIRYLIKPKLNHSPTHTFLVWDTLRLLKKFEGISNIQEHDTVDADITFIFNKQKYALEIEKGNLLGKKEQTKQKIEDLNKKYHKRWMIIVSNKNLLPKYQKLGFSTQRKWVLENLRKLLKTA